MKEKLASDLAQLLDLPVPLVEFAMFGNTAFAISHAHSERSVPLIGEVKFDPVALDSAANSTCILLPFLIWIASFDHCNDQNLVVDRFEDDSLRIRAIDFEHAFDWTATESLALPGPPILIRNADLEKVAAARRRIEQLSDEKIKACCTAVLEREMALQLADILIARKMKLPSADCICHIG